MPFQKQRHDAVKFLLIQINKTHMVYPKKAKFLDGQKFLELFRKFIHDSHKGHRLQKNGQKIKPQTIDQYTYVYKRLEQFSRGHFELKLYLVGNLNAREADVAKKYWKTFYREFTNFLYKLGCYDNYVGHVVKTMRVFFNYLVNEKQLNIGFFFKNWYAPKDEIPIVVFTPQQLAYFISNREFNKRLPQHLHPIKDMFVFGCTVALRISDLMKLQSFNLSKLNGEYYLKVKSKKTATDTSLKLPAYAVDILRKYENCGPTLLPNLSTWYFNKRLKEMSAYVTDNEPMIKIRLRKGEQVMVYKNAKKKQHYTMADHVSSHIMRRTAITTMLSLGMPEQLVRKISGHAPNSKEFYKYVSFSQSLLDTETDKHFKKLLTL